MTLASGRILRAYRVRLAPTVEQRKELARAAGCARAAYNWSLAEWRKQYRACGLAVKAPARAKNLLAQWGSPMASDPRWDAPPGSKPGWMTIHKRLNAVKSSEMPWIDEAPSHAVREAVADVGRAHEHFFRRLREGKVGREAGEPRFRSRRGRVGFHMDEGKALGLGVDQLGREAVRVQKLGWIKVHKRQRGFLPSAKYDSKSKLWSGAKICGIGISEELGEWYASVRVEIDAPRVGGTCGGKGEIAPRVVGKRLGVEVGVRALAVTSDAKSVLDCRGAHTAPGASQCVRSHQRRVAAAERRLALWQRRADRRYRAGASTRDQSAGWREAQHHVRSLYADIANVRDELLHYASRRVVDSGADVIVMRKPGVKAMIGRAAKSGEAMRARNALAPMVSKIGWYELRRRIEYKQAWAHGRQVAGDAFVETPSDFESSRICATCGVARDTPAAYPTFVCSSCGHREDRDDNSAKALRDYRPPSGEPVGSAGTPRGKTTRKRGITAVRSGKRVATDRSVTERPHGDATSPLGAGNGTAAERSADEKGAPPGAARPKPPGEPGASIGSLEPSRAAR